MGLVEGRWSDEDLAQLLAKTTQSFRPDIVYAPSCVDFHPEHIKVGKTLAHVLGEVPWSQQPAIRAYEMQVPLGLELTNAYATLGTHLAAKKRAIAVYKSQRGALDLWRRQARYLGALYGAQNGAEAFWEMSAEGYRQIMEYANWDWRSTPFRSLSGRPFGDLRAHVAGRQTRLTLRDLAGTPAVVNRDSLNG
jgi:LmbE family N-acetylglucosaminyl deacetylase